MSPSRCREVEGGLVLRLAGAPWRARGAPRAGTTEGAVLPHPVVLGRCSASESTVWRLRDLLEPVGRPGDCSDWRRVVLLRQPSVGFLDLLRRAGIRDPRPGRSPSPLRSAPRRPAPAPAGAAAPCTGSRLGRSSPPCGLLRAGSGDLGDRLVDRGVKGDPHGLEDFEANFSSSFQSFLSTRCTAWCRSATDALVSPPQRPGRGRRGLRAACSGVPPGRAPPPRRRLAERTLPEVVVLGGEAEIPILEFVTLRFDP